ncbi:exodeoxyribonuclease III [Pseudodesulfovibrio tunisiensis]|uniref:exodeoxyribonuclease III n=1 Tax=Pseudodesulfovibrio tunisiensis TaxID=463192 RepID=UPI001FB37323|nr:exodeoxyribonuclease III [Pseudodesulfovibrio tunisiensis]
MIIYSWNVNGYRAVIKKNFREWLAACGGDVIMLQETKAEPEQIPEADREPEAYPFRYWNWSKGKKGYSGTSAFARVQPLAVDYGLPGEAYQGEGRVIRMEYEAFHLLNIYFPNGQMSDERLAFKMGFYDDFLAYAEELRKTKPVVVGGDFNTAHTEIDLKNPRSNAERSGFLPEERAWIDTFISHGYVDSFRMFEPGPHHYSWWSYRFNARKNNAGWRIDYFFVSEELRDRVTRAWIEPDVMGSDHCPIGIELDV